MELCKKNHICTLYSYIDYIYCKLYCWLNRCIIENRLLNRASYYLLTTWINVNSLFNTVPDYLLNTLINVYEHETIFFYSFTHMDLKRLSNNIWNKFQITKFRPFSYFITKAEKNMWYIGMLTAHIVIHIAYQHVIIWPCPRKTYKWIEFNCISYIKVHPDFLNCAFVTAYHQS